MIPGRVFVDTNILVYLVDTRDALKQRLAQAVVESRSETELLLSAQVLGEFFTVVTRKLAKPLSVAKAEAMIDALCSGHVQAITPRLVQLAVKRCAASKLSYWDSLIVESALQSGADILCTEDLSHGQSFGRLRVINPFIEAL